MTPMSMQNQINQLIATKNNRLIINEIDIENAIDKSNIDAFKHKVDIINLHELVNLYHQNYQTLETQAPYLNQVLYQDLKTKLLNQIKIASELEKQYHDYNLLFERKQALDHNPKPINVEFLKQLLSKLTK